jgi:hypothetical protein
MGMSLERTLSMWRWVVVWFFDLEFQALGLYTPFLCLNGKVRIGGLGSQYIGEFIGRHAEAGLMKG